jgi:hypothetical protein
MFVPLETPRSAGSAPKSADGTEKDEDKYPKAGNQKRSRR